MALALMCGRTSRSRRRRTRAPPPHHPPPAAARSRAVPVRVVDQPLSVRAIDQRRRPRPRSTPSRRSAPTGAAFSDQLLIYAALVVAVGRVPGDRVRGADVLSRAWPARHAPLVAAGRSQRAWRCSAPSFISASSTWSAAGANVRISPIWANSGTTPTRRLRIATNWKASHGELPPDFDINYVRAPENLFLGPGARSEFGTVFIPMRDIQAAIEQRLHLYVWGRATYEDMFEGSKPHFFEFCHRLEVAGETPEQHRRCASRNSG